MLASLIFKQYLEWMFVIKLREYFWDLGCVVLGVRVLVWVPLEWASYLDSFPLSNDNVALVVVSLWNHWSQHNSKKSGKLGVLGSCHHNYTDTM